MEDWAVWGRISSAFGFIVAAFWGSLSERVEVLDVLRSVSPVFLVKVMKRMDPTNEHLVNLVCAYSANQNIVHTDRLHELTSVVD
jgi:hypothetical protein